jgi:hypothetical protein
MNLLQVMLPIIVVLNATYLYFWLVTLYANAHNHIDRSDVSNAEIIKAVIRAKKQGDPYRFTIQITTRGGSWQVVERGIDYALDALQDYPVLRKIVKIEVITEDQEDVRELTNRFGNNRHIKYFILPKDYETPNGTKFKARALHYMVELHRAKPTDSYIVHYDEESVFTADNLARLARNLLTKPVGISEGSISYPLEWMDAHVINRTMESNRPFGCHECYLVMTHPAPLHLHGSNLVIQERLENEIGWDIGTYQGNPLIAEDLVFGLNVFIKYGKAAFGWHGVEMLEQPPFTLKAAYEQRKRWVMGALQGVNHVRDLEGYDQLPLFERMKIQGIIRVRVLTYAIGLPISIISLTTWALALAWAMLYWGMTGEWNLIFTWLALPGLLMWAGGTQLGLWQNLRYTDMHLGQKLVEHLKVLICTPFAGLFDTLGPAVALWKWSTGQRAVKWKPTPKLVGQEFGDNVKAEAA